ncbi:hypothetical protein BE20_20125 [Sorangium cellulosum]|nr:hypothetical protein BE20_20125 [Sorangium cellulosum]
MLDVPREAPSFPRVAAEMLGSAPPAIVTQRFLLQVETWRTETLAWLSGPERAAHLSDGLAELLRAVLGDPSARRSREVPLTVTSYPAPNGSAVGLAEHRSALDILVWRSTLVDYLQDVWDVIGPALFEVQECGFAVDILLMPQPPSGVRLCIDCLQPLPADSAGQAAHYFHCRVRALVGFPAVPAGM